MNDDDLLNPECELREIVELHRSSDIELWKVCPERQEKIRNEGPGFGEA
jgi:hypothetical protein